MKGYQAKGYLYLYEILLSGKPPVTKLNYDMNQNGIIVVLNQPTYLTT